MASDSDFEESPNPFPELISILLRYPQHVSNHADGDLLRVFDCGVATLLGSDLRGQFLADIPVRGS